MVRRWRSGLRSGGWGRGGRRRDLLEPRLGVAPPRIVGRFLEETLQRGLLGGQVLGVVPGLRGAPDRVGLAPSALQIAVGVAEADESPRRASPRLTFAVEVSVVALVSREAPLAV